MHNYILQARLLTPLKYLGESELIILSRPHLLCAAGTRAWCFILLEDLI